MKLRSRGSAESLLNNKGKKWKLEYFTVSFSTLAFYILLIPHTRHRMKPRVTRQLDLGATRSWITCISATFQATTERGFWLSSLLSSPHLTQASLLDCSLLVINCANTFTILRACVSRADAQAGNGGSLDSRSLLVDYHNHPSSSGPLGRLSRRLRVTLPFLILHLIGTTCGPAAQERAAKCCSYVFLQNNPLGQIIYMGLMVGTYTEFLRIAVPLLPNALLSDSHPHYSFFAMLICVAIFLVCCVSDPGVVTPQNSKFFCEAFDYDHLIYHQNKTCEICRFPAPARSRHCRLCNNCVLRFDHHCIWIGNCVGAKNYRYFLLFLFLHTLLCGYGSFVGGALLLSIIGEKRLFSVMLIEPETGAFLPATPLLVLRYLLGHHTELMLLWTLCVLAGCSLCFFLAMHLTMLLRNKTTNEVVKYRRMSKLLNSLPPCHSKISEAAQEQQAQERELHELLPDSRDDCGEEAQNKGRLSYRTSAREHPSPDQYECVTRHAEGMPRFLSAKEAMAAVCAARNLYDKGSTENCREVFCFESWAAEKRLLRGATSHNYIQ
ncbi:hypothetical protein Esti_003624 [Eimeria stiedai]